MSNLYIKSTKISALSRSKILQKYNTNKVTSVSSSNSGNVNLSPYTKRLDAEQISGVWNFLNGFSIASKNFTYDADNDEILINAKVRFTGDVVSEGGVTAYAVGSQSETIFDNLPVASGTSKGIIQVSVSNGLSIKEGVLSLDASAIDPTLGFTNNVLSVNGSSIDLSSLAVDLSSYATQSWVSSNYSLNTHNHSGVYEPVFTKNTAFNKNFAGSGSETTVSRSDHKHTGTYALIAGSGKQDFAANNLTVAGDLTVAGSITYVDTQSINVEDNLIITRSNATAGLVAGTYTGIQAAKYDGTNDGQLVFGSDGFARVGDVGDLQILATREDSPLANGIAYFDNTTKKFLTKAESSLSVANADTLDSYHASAFPRKAESASITGAWTFNTQTINKGGFRASYNDVTNSTIWTNSGGSGLGITDINGTQMVRIASYGANYINAPLSIGKYTAPAETLDVAGSARLYSSNPVLHIESSVANSANNGKIQFDENGLANSVYIRYDGSTNKLHIGTYDIGDAAFTMRRDNGKIGINNPDPAYQLDVTGAGNFSGDIVTGGNITAGGNIVASGEVTAYSDRRLKSNLITIDNPLIKINQLTGYTYDKDNRRCAGLIAQDVKNVLPEAVHGEETPTTYLSINTAGVMGLAIEGIKALDFKTENLEHRVKRLEIENRELRQQLNQIA